MSMRILPPCICKDYRSKPYNLFVHNFCYKGMKFKMKALKIAYAKLDLSHQIIEANDNFKYLFNLSQFIGDTELPNIPVANVFPHNLNEILQSINSKKINSVMLIQNRNENNSLDSAIMFLYLNITKTKDNYFLRIVNWLNWLHNIYQSFGHSYQLISNLGSIIKKDDFCKISDASCFKAMYPLITYVPNKFVYGINHGVLFDIMNLFIKQRGGEKCTKDYTRNIYSRLRTNLRKEFQLENIEMMDIIQDDQLLNIKIKDEIQIPKTMLKKNIATRINNDKFLDMVINTAYPLSESSF